METPEVHTSSTVSSALNPNCFKSALQDLKELSSQLHHAADHCETAYRQQKAAPQRKTVFENTRNYVSIAIVSVVDHFGCISAKLEDGIHGNVQISEAEKRIDCLVQRLLTTQQYALSLTLSKLRWNVNFPKHHQFYLSSSQHQGKLHDAKRIRATTINKSQQDQPNVILGSLALDASHELRAAVPVSQRSLFWKPSHPSTGSNKEVVNVPQQGEAKKKAGRRRFMSFLRMNPKTLYISR
ncbi:hypothetical protein HPP92_019751 [Vanilla planifolia]|uniref:Protein ABIL5 n=1 Tax=Vanilla planifolia TaxID=51239 RepID=A0A835QA86_VANPL|nr:hypothetical protein HPP92_019751 [Vanilla planifolia]